MVTDCLREFFGTMFNDFPEIAVLTHWPQVIGASDFKIEIFNLVSLIGISGSAFDNTFR